MACVLVCASVKTSYHTPDSVYPSWLCMVYLPQGQSCMLHAAPSLQQCDCSSGKVVWSELASPPLSPSPGGVSVSRGREFLLSLATGRAGLGRPDLAQHTFHQRGRVRVRPAGTGEETASRPEDWSRANNNKDCDQGPG